MVRFLADASLNHAIVSGCLRREPSMSFLSANEAKLEGIPDMEVLARAAEQDRLLVTHDFQTMPWHFSNFVQTHGSSPGVLLISQALPISEAIEELLLIWATTDTEEWRDRILRVPLI
jgi:predicted nuclease of predicted toxin-antitoxin system